MFNQYGVILVNPRKCPTCLRIHSLGLPRRSHLHTAQTRAFDKSERIPCFGVVRCVGVYFALLEVLILIAAFWEALMRYAFACQAARKQSS